MVDEVRVHPASLVATPLWGVTSSELHLLDGAQRRGYSVCRFMKS
jgi:hypothetical protein